MLIVMIACAIGAVLLFALGASSDLWDLWSHPEHKADEEPWRRPKHR